MLSFGQTRSARLVRGITKSLDDAVLVPRGASERDSPFPAASPPTLTRSPTGRLSSNLAARNARQQAEKERKQREYKAELERQIEAKKLREQRERAQERQASRELLSMNKQRENMVAPMGFSPTMTSPQRPLDPSQHQLQQMSQVAQQGIP